MARIAVWQAAGIVAQTPENLARLDQMAAGAAAEGADVVVTPELFATGYAPAEVHTSAGASIRDQLAEIAQRHRVAIVGSSVDREGDQRYISASFFDREGTDVTRYRKSHLFGQEEKSVFVPGTTAPEVFRYAGLDLALGIC